MKLSCFKSSLFLLLFCFKSLFSAPLSAVVYYEEEKPYDILGSFDLIILEPDNTDTNNFGFKKYRDKIFAYVSMCEVNSNRGYFKDIKKEWILSENRVWKSKILDISNPDYRNFLKDRVIGDLVKRGFKNIFFDTVDSYMSADLKHKKKYEKAITIFLKELKERYPFMKIILNRGFEVLKSAHKYIDGVLFESLFRGLDPKTLDYKEVKQKDREWLLAWAKRIRDYNLFAISVDYLPIGDKEAKEVAKKISQLNIIPYITDKDLKTIGVSTIEPIKRRVLILYNSFNKKESSLAFHFAPFLEYYGFIPVFKEISKTDLNSIYFDRYNAAILYFEKPVSKNINDLIKRALNREAKILAFGENAKNMLPENLKLKINIFKEPFKKINKEYIFAVKPFEIFKNILSFNFPIPDVTTKMGKRVAFATVGCKGFDDFCEYEKIKAFKAFKEKILKRYKKIYHSICIPKEYKKKISLKNVEINIDFKKGFTNLTNLHPFLTKISPIGVYENGEYQIFYPMCDEISYTNWWREKFWGYEKAVMTFKLTDSPKRIKPININYNYISLTKTASLHALNKVYGWTLGQNIYPLKPSYYKKTALDFYYISISKAENLFSIKGADFLKTFRILKNFNVNPKKSKNIRKISNLKSGVYIDISSKEAVLDIK